MKQIIYDEQAEFKRDHFRYIVERLGLEMDKGSLDKGTAQVASLANEELRKPQQLGHAYGMPTKSEEDCCKTEALLKSPSVRSQLLTERAYLNNRLYLVNETLALLPEDIDRDFTVRNNLHKLGYNVP